MSSEDNLMIFTEPQQPDSFEVQIGRNQFIKVPDRRKEVKATISEEDVADFVVSNPAHFNQDLDYILGKDIALNDWIEPLDKIVGLIQKDARKEGRSEFVSNSIISKALWLLMKDKGFLKAHSEEDAFHIHQMFVQRLGLRFSYRQNKIQLLFDEKLFSELTKSDISNLVIPKDTFDRLPFRSAWLVPPSPLTTPVANGMKCHYLGFLYEYLADGDDLHIRLFCYNTLEEPGGRVDPLAVCLRSFRVDGKTPLKDAIGIVLGNGKYDNSDELLGHSDIGVFTSMMNCLLYLVSKEPDIGKAPARRTLSKKSAMSMPIASAKLMVGQVIGAMLDTQYHPRDETETNADGTTRKVRTHMRRAHWRVVWKGSTAFGRGEGFQKSELRWIHPSLINADEVASIDEVVSVVRKVS